MTLSTLIISFAVIAILTTFILKHRQEKIQPVWLFYLQNFVGVWFIFSGMVKAIDPMGTAFKMEQYFAAFQQTFEPTWLKFVNPIFPVLANYAVSFSIAMIILELVLGVALIIGYAPKWINKIFFLLLIFFTLLTGFTYLTGYVPSDKNFFDFTSWGAYDKGQMRVSDCGCFGDFLKLDPKISFFKDLGLLIPGIIFLIFGKSFTQLWSSQIRKWIILSTIVFTLLFSWYNTFMNEPIADFRAFKNGADIATTRKNELEAAQSVKIENATATNKKSGEKVIISYPDYLKEFKKYPKEDWDIRFVYGESTVPRTKISDYLIMDTEGKDITLDLLNHPDYSLMISAYKVHGSSGTKNIQVSDTIFADSVYVIGKDTFTNKNIVSIDQKMHEIDVFIPTMHDEEIFTQKINPLANHFAQKGLMVYGVTGGLGNVQIKDFAALTHAEFPIYQADDILLKTIMRSNPGLILWKNGKIVQKWHYKHLPGIEELTNLMK
ncbi:MAG: hypothetical protein ABI844_01930 [Saprospiraceae bacterium]